MNFYIKSATVNRILKRFFRFFIPFFGVGLFVVMGLFLGVTSWDKNLYVQWNPSQMRGLASEGDASPTELLNLSYEELVQDVGSVLFSKHKIDTRGENLAFYLGNVLIPDPYSKSHRFICQVFSVVEFSFSALGVNLSGEEGIMLVQSPCNSPEDDEAFIGPFWIPYQRILASSTKKSFKIPEENTSIRFYNASIDYTPSWLLKRVSFFNENEKDKAFVVTFTPGEANPHFEVRFTQKTDPLPL